MFELRSKEHWLGQSLILLELLDIDSLSPVSFSRSGD